MANSDVTAPRPFRPSITAQDPLIRETTGSAVPSTNPASISFRYVSSRLTPCEGIPRASANVSTDATRWACRVEQPAETSTSVRKASNFDTEIRTDLEEESPARTAWVVSPSSPPARRDVMAPCRRRMRGGARIPIAMPAAVAAATAAPLLGAIDTSYSTVAFIGRR